MSPLNNCCVTAGYDGYVRLWDYGNKKLFYSRKFPTNAQATCLEWLPFSKRNHGRLLCIGFNDGLVRLLGLNQDSFYLVLTLKVHVHSIIKVKANRDNTVIVVVDALGNMFFLGVDSFSLNKITPFCLFETGLKINDICWSKQSDKLLLACQDGHLYEIDVPKESECDYSETYKKDYTFRKHQVRMM